MKPKSILPDAATQTDVILIKSCSYLRPTYEVRLAAYMAQQTHRRLRIVLAIGGSAHSSLTAYARLHNISIEHHR